MKKRHTPSLLRPELSADKLKRAAKIRQSIEVLKKQLARVLMGNAVL